MNPFLLLFKPLFTLFTWILTAFVAVIMSLGGKFDGKARTEGAPQLVAYFEEGTERRPPTMEVQLSGGETFRVAVNDDPRMTVRVSDEKLQILGTPPEDAISTLVQLRSDHGRSMTCRLSYHPIEKRPTGVCMINEDLVYDILFPPPKEKRSNRPRI